MSSVQWFYRPSEQRKKGSKMLRVIMGTVFHLSGLVYYIVYLNNDNPDTNKQVFGISLAMAYIGGILAVWLILNKTLMVKEKRYSLMGDDIEIKDMKNNKTKKHNIGGYQSFSENIRVYNPQQPDSRLKEEKLLYLGKEGSTTPLRIEVNNEDVDRVKEVLKERFKELG